MKTGLIFAASILFLNFAHASESACSRSQGLTCSSTYNLVQSESVSGPTGYATFDESQNGGLDTINCVDTVVLYSYVGKFVAAYDLKSDTLQARLNADGHETLLRPVGPSPWEFIVKSPFNGDVQSANFYCKVYNPD